MTRAFHERFGIEVGQDEARRRFINRCLNLIFDKYFGLMSPLTSELDLQESANLEARVASALGERHATGAVNETVARSLPKTLIALEAIHRELRPWPSEQLYVDSTMKQLLGEAEVDLGVRWSSGAFMPAGAQELDDPLVNEPLKWMDKTGFESVRAPYRKALRHYLESTNDAHKLSDVVTDLYESVEALAKIYTGRPDKDLSANAELFIAKVAATESFKPILRAYIAYANSFRHSADERTVRPLPKREEVESFLYLTGVIIRLAMPVEPPKLGAA